MTAQITVSAPAKVNLWLGVGAPRGDGYHPLATVYQAIGLFDDVRVRPADTPSLTVYGDGVDVSDVPDDERNLAWRAAVLLAEHHGIDEAVEIHIHKRIPVAGGLAGGSTDAAAALVACDALWATRTPREELLDLAAELGSDVPFCLVGGTAIGHGRGEQIMSVITQGSYWWVVVPAEGGLSTPAVYDEFDRLSARARPEPGEIPAALLTALRAGDVASLGDSIGNGLEPAALSLAPELGERLVLGRDAGARGALVSGSGPTTIYLCDSPEHAADVAQVFDQPVLVAEAPVHGARVVSR